MSEEADRFCCVVCYLDPAVDCNITGWVARIWRAGKDLAQSFVHASLTYCYGTQDCPGTINVLFFFIFIFFKYFSSSL